MLASRSRRFAQLTSEMPVAPNFACGSKCSCSTFMNPSITSIARQSSGARVSLREAGHEGHDR